LFINVLLIPKIWNALLFVPRAKNILDISRDILTGLRFFPLVAKFIVADWGIKLTPELTTSITPIRDYEFGY
jgi:hypothetical protein